MGDQVVDSSQSQTHMSADDLNDGFILDKDDQKTLSYQVQRKARRRVSLIKNQFISGIFFTFFL